MIILLFILLLCLYNCFIILICEYLFVKKRNKGDKKNSTKTSFANFNFKYGVFVMKNLDYNINEWYSSIGGTLVEAETDGGI